jgi:hypothetical protein
VVYVQDETFVLTPLVGETVRLPLREVKIQKETSFFNGSWYPGQTGFWLYTEGGDYSRLGFAVSDGEAWKAILTSH